MPRAAAKRKVSNTGQCEESPTQSSPKAQADSHDTDHMALQKATRAPRKAPARRTEQRAGKNTTSDLQAGTLRPRDANSALKKRKMGVHDAKKQVQKQGDDLVDFIERQLELRPHTFNQMKVDEQMSPDLAPVLPWMTGTPSGWSSQTPAYPPQMMATALDDLQGIIETYEKMNSQANGIKEPAWMRWEQDGSELSELNQHAMSFAAQTVNHTIMPGRHGYTSEPHESAGDIERMAWEMVEQGRPKNSEETWGTAAQDQVKSFTAVLRLLPPKK